MALDLDQIALTAGNIDQQADRKRQVGLFGEVFDLLFRTVLSKLEIVLLEAVDEPVDEEARTKWERRG